jgi:hypothetical protein
MAMSDVKSALAPQGLEVTSGTTGSVRRYIKREIAKIARIAKTAGVKAE